MKFGLADRKVFMAHPFMVGEKYFDRRGTYEVIRVVPPNITIRYEDGREETVDIETKARIYRNMVGEQRARHPHQSSGYFRTLGFLAKNAVFHAEVPPQSQANFEEKYRTETGVTPKMGQDNYFPIEIETTYDKWGSELRIYYPERELELPTGIEARAGHAPRTLRINNNHFWWGLVRLGFRLGSRHDLQQIRKTIPAKYKKDFDAGLGE